MPLYAAPPSVRVLASSATAVSHTGNTNETVLGTVSIPAGAMGLNGMLRISSLWTVTNSGNNKTTRTRLGGIGGTIFESVVLTTSASFEDAERIIQNRGSASSQVSRNSGSSTGGGSTSAVTTGTVNTAVAQDLVFTGQLASGTETITLESYLVELITP